MKMYQGISRLLVVLLLAIGLTGCGSIATGLENFTIGEGSGSGKLVSLGQESFKAEEFDNIHINANAMAIFVTKSTSDDAEVELLADDTIDSRFTLEASIKSKKLSISVKEKEKKGKIIKDTKGERKLNISLPDKLYDQLTINNNFGLAEVADLNAESIDISVDAGSIQLNGVVGEMKLEVNSGQIVVEGISLENNLTAKTDVGEIRVHLNEAPASAKLNLVSEIGNVTANLEGIEYDVNSTNKKVGTIGASDYYIDATTSMGSILVDVKK